MHAYYIFFSDGSTSLLEGLTYTSLAIYASAALLLVSLIGYVLRAWKRCCAQQCDEAHGPRDGIGADAQNGKPNGGSNNGGHANGGHSNGYANGHGAKNGHAKNGEYSNGHGGNGKVNGLLLNGHRPNGHVNGHVIGHAPDGLSVEEEAWGHPTEGGANRHGYRHLL